MPLPGNIGLVKIRCRFPVSVESALYSLCFGLSRLSRFRFVMCERTVHDFVPYFGRRPLEKLEEKEGSGFYHIFEETHWSIVRMFLMKLTNFPVRK